MSTLLQGHAFKRFWLLVMLLRLCEQFLEAPFQIIINVTYTAVYDPEGCDDDNNLLTIWESDNTTFITKLNESYQTCIFSLVRLTNKALLTRIYKFNAIPRIPRPRQQGVIGVQALNQWIRVSTYFCVK